MYTLIRNIFFAYYEKTIKLNKRLIKLKKIKILENVMATNSVKWF